MTDVVKAFELEVVLRSMLRGLVDAPQAVSVLVSVSGSHVSFEVRVAADDTGKVIGKQGRTARAMRTILSGCAMKLGISMDLNIVNARACADGELVIEEVSDDHQAEA